MNLSSRYLIKAEIKLHPDRVIYRAIRKSDSTSVIIKTLRKDYPLIEETASLLHEYNIVKNINSDNIIKVYDLERDGNNVALILEDFGGQSLDRLIKTKKLKLKEVLEIGIKLASILEELYQNQIIHKDIKASNIIINPQTLQVKLTDFGLATQLTKETNVFKDLDDDINSLTGTLGYIAPEQTGRMNRAIDYRSDFYSFGITLYEMLTGQLPFQVNDPLELIHSHIAVTPISPQQINPEIPQVVSDIVMKLLEKNAEHRYQSASGLKADLEKCLDRLLNTGKIEPFSPAETDRCGQFLIPEKLYGRSKEIANLLSAFDRVSSGNNEIVLVSGYSGIGKTSVINEIHKPIVKRKGYFVSGKFDLLQKNIPYKAIVEACKSLIQKILTESPDRIAKWQEKLKSNLGENGAVIAEVIPEINLIIGSQPPVPELGPNESQNRFNRVFKKFVRVFAAKEHPLVLFLDDLQWADLASLKLINLLATEEEIESLLIIGAYRDNEVNPTHPLIKTIDTIQEEGVIINSINLQPLNLDCILELISDTFQCNKDCPLESYSDLAELVFAKTGGNPFFINTLLQTLYSENLLTFNYNSGCWEWDIQHILAVGITDRNVVELIAANLKKLSLESQKLLKLAACIGYKFDLNTLAIINEKSQSETATYLWPALQNGLILPLSDRYKIPLLFGSETLKDRSLDVSYKFLHDRVQQAAYCLIPDLEKKETHLKIGRLLLKNISAEAREANIFNLVNQLNISRELIVERAELDILTELNLTAGKKAKTASAYQAACEYLNVGLELLEVDSWQKNYDLSLALHTETAEVEYLNANFDRAENLSDIVLEKSNNLLEKVTIYETQIQYYIAQSQMKLAIDLALFVLEQLGISLPKKPNQLRIILGLIKTKLTQGNRSIEDLAELPKMSDPYKIAAMRILTALIPAAFVAMPNLFPLIIFKMLNLSFKYGNSPESAICYNGYGIINCAILGDINSGYRYGQIALSILEQLNLRSLKSKIYLVRNTFINHWKEHIKETIEPLVEGVQSGLETGNIEDACYCATQYCGYLFLSGEPLPGAINKQVEYIKLMEKYKQEVQINHAKVWGQLVLNLLAYSKNNSQLIGKLFNEETKLPLLVKVEDNQAIFATYLAKSLLCYLFKDYNVSLDNAALAEKYSEGSLGSAYIPLHHFYYSLSLLAQYPHVSKQERRKYLKKVAALQKKMNHWAKHCPDNYLHKYQLVEAEKARVLGENQKAIQYYYKAIKAANAAKYIQEEALANELFAEFYLSLERDNKAIDHLMNAYYGYGYWGAVAKVKDLEKRYPQILNKINASQTNAIEIEDRTRSIRSGNLQMLDLTTVLKASQAIASEIVLDRLVSKLMHILMENAGGQKGMLFLQQDNAMVLAAEAVIDDNKKIVLCEDTVCENSDWPRSLIQYVQRTKETLIFDDPKTRQLFSNDPYILLHQPKSILSFPLISQNQLRGIIYLENRLVEGAFTQKRLKLLNVLTAQVSISIENARLYRNLEHQAFHDPLTNLPNRRLFNHRLDRAIEDAKKNRSLVGVVFLDLDRFKKINDSLSHEVGDRILQDFAERLKGCLREIDTVARWGGDEFTMLFPKINSEEDLVKIVQRIFDSLKEPFKIQNHSMYIKTTMGIAVYPDRGEDGITLLKNADSALNKAKAKGKNTYQFYNKKIDSKASYLLKLDNALHEALDRQEFALHYQPQINAKTGEIVGMEALMRWKHPKLGVISPGQFIPLMEENGLIVPIGEWVLRTACAQNKAWQDAGLPKIKVAVNISCKQFQQQDLVPMVNQILATTELQPEFLELEITESTIMSDRDLATIAMRDLQAIGVYLSMDDFGTGYSSLSYLKDFPFDSIKIDRAFVRGLGKDPRDTAILRAVISLGYGLNLRVVAEGVETPGQLELLQDLKCEDVQGYLFSRPLPVEDATNFLNRSISKNTSRP